MNVHIETVNIATKNPRTDERQTLSMQGIVVDNVFMIHDAIDYNEDCPLVLAHIGTGYKIAECADLAKALYACQEIANLALDWSFTDPLAVKSWPQETLALIGGIKIGARDE